MTVSLFKQQQFRNFITPMDEELDSIINFLNDKEVQKDLIPSSKCLFSLPQDPKPSSLSLIPPSLNPPQSSMAYSSNSKQLKPIEEFKQINTAPIASAHLIQTPSAANSQSQVQNRAELLAQNSYSSQNITTGGGEMQQKQNDFIIKRGVGQNKRVISQIRSTYQQTMTGFPPTNKTALSNTSSKKKKKGVPMQMQQQMNMHEQRNVNEHSNVSHISDYGKLLMNQMPPPVTTMSSNIQQKKLLMDQNSFKQKQMKEEMALQKALIDKRLEIEQSLSLQKQNSKDQQLLLKQARVQLPPSNQQQENPQDPKLDAENIGPEEISAKIKKKFLIFRPYEDPISIRPYQPADRGYYFKLYNNDVKIIRYTMEDNGFREIPQKESKEWTLMWSCCALKPQIYQALTKYQKVNHFPSSFHITRKDLMYKSVSKMREIHGQKHFNFIPKTYLLPNEFVYLEAEMERDKDKLWIAKPSASSQGKGIIVTNKLAEIPNKSSPHIVSEYINNPLLFDGYKFDLRVYVAITSVNPLRLYVYDDGLTRFATSKYNNNISGNKKQSKYTHLTNYSLNKNNPNFIANTDPNADGVGSKWSLTALKKAFKEQGIDHTSVWKKIEDILIKTILAAEPTLFSATEQNCQYRNTCFELLGFDILIDDCLDPWLLEVNLSPSLNCDSPLDQRIKGHLIADLFTLAGVVPLEQRNAGGAEGQYAQKKGVFYGAYQQENVNMSQVAGLKRDSHTANANKRKESQKPNIFGDTTGTFGGYGAVKLQSFTPKQEKQIIKETEQEFKRRGKFKRIFPSVDYHYYKQFFLEERPLNILLDQRVMSKRRLNNAVASAMSVKQRIEYLNNRQSMILMMQNANSSSQQMNQSTFPMQTQIGESQALPLSKKLHKQKMAQFSQGEMADRDEYSGDNNQEEEEEKTLEESGRKRNEGDLNRDLMHINLK